MLIPLRLSSLWKLIEKIKFKNKLEINLTNILRLT